MKKNKISRYFSYVLVLGIILASLNTGFISYAASTEYIYVLVKVQNVGKYTSSSIKYSYNSDGFMKREDIYENLGSGVETGTVTDFKYSKGRIMSVRQVVRSSDGVSSTYNTKYYYNKKNLFTKAVCNGPDNYVVTTNIDYDKNNRKIKETMVIKGWTPKCINNYKYNSKGQLIKYSTNNFGENYGGAPVNEEYKYDNKGFVKTSVRKMKMDGQTYVTTTKRNSRFQNGRIISATDRKYDENNTCTDTVKKTFTYKKIKINKKYKELIEEQQQEIILDRTR
jgi:hypothetical protein